MKCEKCGSELMENAKFCENCGAPVETVKKKPSEKKQSEGRPMMPVGQRISENIVLCRDGAYRWVYEYNLFKNPSILFLVWRIFFFIFLGIMIVVTIADSGRRDFFPDVFLNNLKIFGIIFLVMTVIVVLGYLLYAAIMGGKYCVIFEMDEKGINHKQMPQQAKKAELLAAITVLAGLAGGNVTAMGVGASAARTEMYSEFSKVKKVKSYPKKKLIKVNGALSHNQVFAEKEDFAFVEKFILDHCANIKTTTTVK